MRAESPGARHLSLPLLAMFWIAQAVSLFGDRLNNFSLAALINRFADDPGMTLTWLYFAMYLPIFTLAPLIGVFIDRLSKRWVLVITDAVRGGLVMLIPLIFLHTGRFAPVMGLAFLLSTGNIFFLPAKSALVPELVAPDRLVRTNAILWTAGIGGVVAGFLLGGIIFDYLSWPACFYIDGATYILSSVLLLVIALRTRHSAAPVPGNVPTRLSIASSIREGITSLKSLPTVRGPLGIQTIIFFGSGGYSVLTMHFIKEASPPGSSLGLSAAGLSIGLGMAAGSYLVNRIRPSSRTVTGYWFFASLAPATAVIALGKNLIAIGAGSCALGLAASPLFVLAESELQERIPEHLRGRIFSIREILTKSLFLLSAFLFSMLGGSIPREVLLTALGLVLACTGVAWIRSTRHFVAEGK